MKMPATFAHLGETQAQEAHAAAPRSRELFVQSIESKFVGPEVSD
jgi:hypothetical protein